MTAFACGNPIPPAVSVPGDNAWFGRARVAGVAGIAALLPLLVDTRTYDFYYWPKVEGFYLGIAMLGVLTLWDPPPHRWFRDLRSPVTVTLVCWLGALALATFASVDPLLSLAGADYRYEGLTTWIGYGAVAIFAGVTLISPQRIRFLMGATFLAAGVMAVLGLLQHLGWAPVPEDILRAGWTRAWGTTGSPLALAAYLVLLLPVLVSVHASATRPLVRGITGGLGILLYAALVATWARASWASLGVGLIVSAAAVGGNRLRRAAGSLVVLGALCALATPLVIWTGPALPRAHASDFADAGARLYLWKTAAPLVLRRPLFGWGPETLAEIYPAYGSPEFSRVFPEARVMKASVDRPHNDLLQQAISAGLVGLAAYVAMWMALLQTAWKAARTDRGGGLLGGLGAGLLGGFTAYFVQLQFSFSYVSVAPVFWVLVGAVLTLERMPGSAPGYPPGVGGIKGTVR